MSPKSAKSKGRLLQQYVRDNILARFPDLEPDDVRSTSMGAGGEDIQLSPAARKVFPFSIECKSLAKIAVYKYYDQAKSNSGESEPLVILKQNQKRPLALLDLDAFLGLINT